MTDESSLEPSPLVDATGALLAEEFHLVYQPEIDLHTGGFAGVEALIRWYHPIRGVLSPAEFIPALEENGQILDVGRWALETACFQGAEWFAKGYRFPVAVNISRQQLSDSSFVDDVARALRASRLDPAYLTLEFSFASLDGENALSHLREIHDSGVRLAIDDFAPGHPDNATLATLPIDIVKLDREFVAEHSTLSGDSDIHALVHDARGLDLRVIASGVEDASQRDQLRDEEVDIGQGFHFARPYEVQEIDRFLEDFALFSGRPL